MLFKWLIPTFLMFNLVLASGEEYSALLNKQSSHFCGPLSLAFQYKGKCSLKNFPLCKSMKYPKKKKQGPIVPMGPIEPSGPAESSGPAEPSGPTGARWSKGSKGAAGARWNKGSKGARGSKGAEGPTGPAGPKGATGPAGTISAYAMYYAKMDEIVPESDGTTFALIEFEQNPPFGADPNHENINVGGFTVFTEDTNTPDLITSIGVPSTGLYNVTVFLNTASSPSIGSIALVKNIGTVTPGSMIFTGTVTDFTTINAAISSSESTNPYLNSIISLNQGDRLSIINASTLPLGLTKHSNQLSGAFNGNVTASITIQFLGFVNK